MSRISISNLINRIYKSKDTEIDCLELQDYLPTYVDLEIEDPSKTGQYPQVSAHLEQCPDCADEYESLLQVASLEAQNAVPDAETLLDHIEEGKEETDQLPLLSR